MRDAFGGTFMIKLMLTFLAVYIAFIAVALNYAKAFRVKNKIIDIIEQNEGMEESDFDNISGANNSGVTGLINGYLGDISYFVNLDEDDKKGRGVCFDKGFCIHEFEPTYEVELDTKYYKVTTFVRIEFPFFGLDFNIPIQGETRKIERIS